MSIRTTTKIDLDGQAWLYFLKYQDRDSTGRLCWKLEVTISGPQSDEGPGDGPPTHHIEVECDAEPQIQGVDFT